MKLARGTWLALGGGGAVLCLLLAVAAIFVNDRYPLPLAIPVMFFTLYGLFLVVAVGLALGLPAEQAGFWRTLVLALAVFRFDAEPMNTLNHWLWTRDQLRIFAGDTSYWTFNAVKTALLLASATVLAGLAYGLRRRAPASDVEGRFHLRLWHFFALTTLVAVTCVAVRAPVGGLIILSVPFVVLAAHLAAAFAIGARRGPPRLWWGFLMGSFGLAATMTSERIIEEWEAVLPRELGLQLLDYRFVLCNSVLQFYAGLATGVLAASLYRPPPAQPAPETQ